MSNERYLQKKYLLMLGFDVAFYQCFGIRSN